MAVELQELSGIGQPVAGKLPKGQQGNLDQEEFSDILAAVMNLMLAGCQEALPEQATFLETKAAGPPAISGLSSCAIEGEAALTAMAISGGISSAALAEANVLLVSGPEGVVQGATSLPGGLAEAGRSVVTLNGGAPVKTGYEETTLPLKAGLQGNLPAPAGENNSSFVSENSAAHLKGGTQGSEAAHAGQPGVITPEEKVQFIDAVNGANRGVPGTAGGTGRDGFPGADMTGAGHEKQANYGNGQDSLYKAQDVPEPAANAGQPTGEQVAYRRLYALEDSVRENDSRETARPERRGEGYDNRHNAKADFLQPQIKPTAVDRTFGGEAPPKSLPPSELPDELPRIVRASLVHAAGRKGSREFIIQLEPKELGRLLVKLTSHEGVVSVKIAVEHAETKTLLENGMQSLRQSFSEQGIRYGRLEVELGGQFMNPQQHQQPNWFGERTDYRGGLLGQQAYQEEEYTAPRGAVSAKRTGIDYLV